jgi:nucleotide-binding universal stress UspA family protein
MTVALHAESSAARRKSGSTLEGNAKATLRPRRILAAVDGSERTNRVIDYLVTLARTEPIEVVILNTQPRPEDWRLRGYGTFKQSEIHDRLINDLGKPVVTSVARHLDRAGIAHKDRIELGEPAQTIVDCARTEGCDVVIIGEPRQNRLRQWLARTVGLIVASVAGRVVQLAETPVIVVR